MKAKIVQYGCGKMSKYLIRYALEKGMTVTGAFDIDSARHGIDIAELIGANKPLGVKISPHTNLESFLIKRKPDAVIIATASFLDDLEDVLTLCAKHGANAITICEEAFYPQNSNPKLFAKIDKLAKASGATITGSGYQDVFWGNLITTLAGSVHKITKITGTSSYDVEHYGIALAKAHGAGMTPSEFAREVSADDKLSEQERNKLINSGTFKPSYMWTVNGWLASSLGLTVTAQSQKCIPQIAKVDLKSKTLGKTIHKGEITGMSAVVTTQTKEGVVIESECIGKVYDSTEFDRNIWTIHGEPNTTVVIDRPETVQHTCATIINRIPDLISAPAGFITTEKMPVAKFRK